MHPVVFQLYKSFWVCTFGLTLVGVRAWRGESLAFSPGATASAAAWIPRGPASVPRRVERRLVAPAEGML